MGRLYQPRTGHRAKMRGESARLGGGEIFDGIDAERRELCRRLAADAPERVGRLPAEHLEPGVVRQPENAGRLAEPGRQLGLQLVLPDADRAVKPRHRLDALLDAA